MVRKCIFFGIIIANIRRRNTARPILRIWAKFPSAFVAQSENNQDFAKQLPYVQWSQGRVITVIIYLDQAT